MFCHLHRQCKHHFLYFAICIGSASVKTFVFTFAERRCVFGMVGAVPVCPPERLRSGVSMPKYICAPRIMHEDLTMDAPLAGRHGRAHRYRPYQTPSYFSVQSVHNQRPLRPRFCKSILHLEMNERPGNPYIILNGPCRETRITRPTYINVCTSALMLF